MSTIIWSTDDEVGKHATFDDHLVFHFWKGRAEPDSDGGFWARLTREEAYALAEALTVFFQGELDPTIWD